MPQRQKFGSISQDANPGIYVGGKFLDRAAADSKDKLEKAIIKTVSTDMEEMFGK